MTALDEEGFAIQRCQNGDREAFALIVRTYMRPTFYVALGYVGRPDDALDLSHDAFVKALRHIRRFDPSKRFFPWFYSILKHVCLNHVTRRRRRREQSIEVLAEDQGDIRIPVETLTPEASAIHGELEAKVGRALRRMRPMEREIIILQHFRDCSYQEIADLLGVPIGTVMSRLHGARRSLRRQLEALGVRA